jgi:hypothetical protein
MGKESWMRDLRGLTLQVRSIPDGDLDELVEVTGRLRTELLDLDVAAVEPVSQATAPEHAKGLATLAGWLLVQFGTVSGLRAVVDAVRSWATRTNRQVEISYGEPFKALRVNETGQLQRMSRLARR